MEKAVFAGGCFWCTEAIFQRLIGVKNVLPGYSGGDSENPTYEEVCSGNTNHAEAIQIEFDNSKIPYSKLLEVFFYTHDPTTPNQQGNDVGSQYRSAIFHLNEDQKNDAENLISKLGKDKVFERPIVTTVEKFTKFYEAEDYHKNYFDKNKDAPYCNATIVPKIKKLLDKYGSDVKEEYK